MVTESPINDLPPELLAEIVNYLSWRQQLGVRRVSRRWRAAVDSCLARRQELHVSGDCGIASLWTLANVVKRMPTLRRLSIVGRSGDNGPFIELGSATAEWLCAVCPLLQEVILGDKVEEDGVKSLLRCLPGMLKLSLPEFSSSGEFLALLPEGLQLLTLRFPRDIKLDFFANVRRMPELRVLSLRVVPGGGLPAMLAASCSQLEELCVSCSSPPNWTAALTHCPRLRKLCISGGMCMGYGIEFDPCDALNTCGQLERLEVHRARLWLSRVRHSRQPGLTHLDLSGFAMDDATFRQLPDILPRLCHMRLGYYLDYYSRLTKAGLTAGLRRFTSLRVLELEMTVPRVTGEVLSGLGDLPLTALSLLGVDADAHQVATVLQRCSELTMLRLPWTLPGPIRALIDELGSDPPRRVTLFLPSDAAREVTEVPGNVRVVEDDYRAWRKLTGWRRLRL